MLAVNTLLKKSNTAFVLAMILALLLVQIPKAYSAASTPAESALVFLSDVAGLDMAKYNVKLLKVINSDVNTNLVTVGYALTSNESELEVICDVKSNAVIWCKLYPLEGTPLYTQTTSNVIDAANDVLSRYQSYSGASHVQPMRNMLDTVTEFTVMTETVGDIKLETTLEGGRENIQWMRAVNGITNTYDVVTVSFRNGKFEFFCDFWDRYGIGSADVKVDREEAIRIAKENALNRIRADVGDEAASDFTFVEEQVHTILTMQPRENLLYPYWEVLLGLNKMVSTFGAAFRVSVWADTGSVAYLTYSGSYGAVPSEETPSASPPPDQTPSPDIQPENSNPTATMYLIVGATAILVTVSLVGVFLKKRCK